MGIEKIQAAFKAGRCKKVVIVRNFNVGSAHALKDIGHFGVIVLEIDVIGVPDVFEIKIRKCFSRILEKLCQFRMNFAVSNQEPIRQPRPIGVPKKPQRKEMTALQRQDYGEARRHSTDFFCPVRARRNQSNTYNKHESGRAKQY